MSHSETAPIVNIYHPPPIYKGPPRPAPTQAYDFNDYLPKPQLAYVQTLEQANTALATLTQSGSLGFDIEWRPTFKKGVPENPAALIQLANDKFVVLFQVSSMPEFPSELKQILESPHVVKAGVGIQGDAKKLFKDWKVSMCNCVDLPLLARTVDNARWQGIYNSPIGLARLIECYEYKLLLKGRVSRSDWTASLNSKQQEYAGNDAHAGYTLFKKLEAMIPLMPSLPKAVWYSFDVSGGALCNDDGLPWLAENPDYDSGPLPEPRPPTEAQLQKKKKRAETRAAQQASSSSRGEHAAPWPLDSFPPISKPAIYPVGTHVLSPQTSILNSIPARSASSFTTRQVSGFHHSAARQTTARNISQDQRFQSTLTNRSGLVCYPQSNAEVSQPRPFPETGRRHAPRMLEAPPARNQHGSNRRSHRGHNSNCRDNLGPSTTLVRGNP